MQLAYSIGQADWAGYLVVISRNSLADKGGNLIKESIWNQFYHIVNHYTTEGDQNNLADHCCRVRFSQGA